MRFERACRIGNPTLVVAAAHELPRPVQLRHALRVVLVLAAADPERFPAAAARFGSRLVIERRLTVTEAQLAFAALQSLATPDPQPGGEALSVLLERDDEPDAANHLDEWLKQRPR